MKFLKDIFFSFVFKLFITVVILFVLFQNTMPLLMPKIGTETYAKITDSDFDIE